MRQEEDNQFKVPSDEPQPVDNFSAPENKGNKPSPLEMPSNTEVKSEVPPETAKSEPPTSEPINPGSVKAAPEGEIEDVFAEKGKTSEPAKGENQEVHKLDFPQEKKSGRCCC